MRTALVKKASAGRFRSVALTGLSLVVAGALAACGGTSGGTGGTSAASPAGSGSGVASADPAVAALLPSSIKSSGVLRVAVPVSGAPYEETKDGQLVGMEPDLANAVAALMGLKAEISHVPFAQALTGLQADRYDMSYGEFYVTAERQKVADFVTHWQTYSSFLTQKSDSFEPGSLTDLCGHTVAGMTGTPELALLQGAVANCASAGKPLTVSAFPDYGSAILALSSKRIDGILNDRGGEELTIKEGQPFKISGHVVGGPCAIAIRREDDAGDQQLAKAVQKAYETLIADGKYADILNKNGTSYGAITNPTIYTATTTPPNYG